MEEAHPRKMASKSRPTDKRVVITGLGVICSIGNQQNAFRRRLFEGYCGIGEISLFDTQGFHSSLGAQVRGSSFLSHRSRRYAKRASRCDLLGLTAAAEAIADAGLGDETSAVLRARGGVIMGGGAGGMLSWERYRRARRQDSRTAKASRVLAASPGTLADLIAARYGFCGPRATFSTACSSSTTAIGYAAELVRMGRVPLAITGGSEALSELTFAGFNALRATDPGPCRPFDRNRRGLSLGEGAAVFVLEPLARVLERGGHAHAEVLGYATSCDAFHLTAPDPKARGMRKVMAIALANAGVHAAEVDYINAHGTGTPINDRAETMALRTLFGSHAERLAISSTKSMVGHCLGASGAIEAAATVLALQDQMVPPTVGLTEPDPECDLDYVAGTARQQRVGLAVSSSFAFGGNNSALVLKRA
jgi:3-oxoacyl-[acyl-carrier-protein] synthase II